ncbi:protoporphyrinogen oxidase [Arthrobacter sp. A5]|uniref:protoporphyrinogen oxidase n=1 Tax=Arthrobacter sp. A5 TaxID=576926 RepID=UPI003DA98CD4
MSAGEPQSRPQPRPRSKPRAVVVGGGISGLVAARDLAAAGHRVTVLEAGHAFGGCVGSHGVAGLLLDSGAESFATRSTAVADLAADLGLGGSIVSPDPAGAWVQLPDGPLPLPRTGVLGIPADPHAPEVRRALGFAGSLRAALDARLPASVGTTAEECSVAALVRARMGRKVLERLVAPVVGGVHSADPELIDVDVVAPGLRKGILQHGSLAAAVSAQRASAKAGSAVGGLAGGMFTLVSALTAALRQAGVELHVGHPVTAISRNAPAESVTKARGGANRSFAAGAWTVSAGDWTTQADVLVVATDGPAAVRLLGPAVPALAEHAPAAGPDVRLVTLVLDLPELDTKPRGTGILVAPQTSGIRAKALTHATAKWQWLADLAGPGRHVLRLSYGRAGTEPAMPSPAGPSRAGTEPATDEELLAAALADASTLLSQTVSRGVLVDWDVVRWPGSLPFAAVGHRKEVAEVRAIARRQPGLLLLGGWLAGNGLSAVVMDARAAVALLLSD